MEDVRNHVWTGYIVTLLKLYTSVRVSLVVRIPVSHTGGPGSIPGRGKFLIDFTSTVSVFHC